jgi:hypothetical protein
MAFIVAIDWERIFDRYGWPTLILVIVGVIFKKAIWPRITKYLDAQERIADEARTAIINRANKLEEREDTQLKGFTEALDGLKDVLETATRRQETQILLMEETLKLVKDTNEITRRNQR